MSSGVGSTTDQMANKMSGPPGGITDPKIAAQFEADLKSNNTDGMDKDINAAQKEHAVSDGDAKNDHQTSDMHRYQNDLKAAGMDPSKPGTSHQVSKEQAKQLQSDVAAMHSDGVTKDQWHNFNGEGAAAAGTTASTGHS